MTTGSNSFSNYYTTNNNGIEELMNKPTIFEATFEVDVKAFAKGTAKYTEVELDKINRLRNKVKGV